MDALSAVTKRPNIDFVTDRLATGGDLHPDPEVALRDLEAIVAAGVTHIIDVRVEWTDEEFVAEHAPHLVYVHLGVDDAGQRMPDEWFDAGRAAASAALADPAAKVLTHCHMGINRGPSLTFSLLLADGWAVADALDAIRRARPIAALGYAEDALRHHHQRHDVDFEQREQNWVALTDWFTRNEIDVTSVIRGIRAAEGTVMRSVGAPTDWSIDDESTTLLLPDNAPARGTPHHAGLEPVTGEQVLLRPLEVDDLDALVAVLAEPEVARWWHPSDEHYVRTQLGEQAVVYVVEPVDEPGTVIGLVQYYEQTDPRYRHAGVDIALHPAWHGRGLGTDAVRTMTRHLFTDRGHHRVVIDPAVDNARAIHCYEKAGFRPVGVMRSYELGPDETFHDGLLMDMLAEDLTERDGPPTAGT